MCDPLTLTAAATAVSAIGSGVGALQSAAASRYQARVAAANAQMEDEAAQTTIANTKTQAQAQYRRIAAQEGQQQSAMAANGIDTNFGSAARVKADTAMLGGEDVQRIYDQGSQQVRNYDINAANDRAQVTADRQAASGALVKGVFDMGSTVLSGASQYSTMQSRYKQTGYYR